MSLREMAAATPVSLLSHVMNSLRKSYLLGEKTIGGCVFRSYVGDHPPLHAHVFWRGRQIGRWDIEHQRPLDSFAVTAVSLGSDGYAVVVEQLSGNRLDVPWDVILHHAEPDYPFYKHGAEAAGALDLPVAELVSVRRLATAVS